MAAGCSSCTGSLSGFSCQPQIKTLGSDNLTPRPAKLLLCSPRASAESLPMLGACRTWIFSGVPCQSSIQQDFRKQEAFLCLGGLLPGSWSFCTCQCQESVTKVQAAGVKATGTVVLALLPHRQVCSSVSLCCDTRGHVTASAAGSSMSSLCPLLPTALAGHCLSLLPQIHHDQPQGWGCLISNIISHTGLSCRGS